MPHSYSKIVESFVNLYNVNYFIIWGQEDKFDKMKPNLDDDKISKIVGNILNNIAEGVIPRLCEDSYNMLPSSIFYQRQ